MPSRQAAETIAMRTTTRLRFGPRDHNRPVTEEELRIAEFVEGFRYEVIDGRLYVSPQASLPENRLESWLFGKVYGYALGHPAVINYVSGKARIFIPQRPQLTVPEPDLAAYCDFPLDTDIEDVRWEDISPILVGEVLTGDPYKDLERNVKLYWQIPSIREYWALDGCESQSQPTLKVHRRHGKRWIIRDYPFDSIYTTRMLPGFELPINPRR